MKIPKAIWRHSLETEADRVIQAAAQTRQRFYQKYGFLVLPKLIPGKANIVFLPDLGFNKIKGFWRAVEKAKLDIPMPVPEKIRQAVVTLLEKSHPKGGRMDSLGVFIQLKSQWQTKEKSFWQAVFELFSNFSKKKIKVEIRPTKFGSVSSFNLVDPKSKNLKVKIYIRLDASPGQIAEAILSSLFKPSLGKEGYGWKETESVIDFLLNYTKLSQIFADFKPTLRSIRNKENARLATESQNYQKKLGIPSGEIFTCQNGQVLIDGKTPVQNFTQHEEKVLQFLVANKNSLCSFDQLGDLIWEDRADELFSIWAISKLIQRIRNKFQANGIAPIIIQTQRGQGYVLRD